MRARKDPQTGPRLTSDSLHLHLGGYRRKSDLSSPTQEASYHPPVAVMYILRDVLVDAEHGAPNKDVACPEALRPRPHAPTSVWLVAKDNQCTQAEEQAPL